MEAAQNEQMQAQMINRPVEGDKAGENNHERVGTQQFVTFAIGSEEYAVDIMQVREIQAWTEVTILPNQPSYMRGVLNLRGIIVPIFDLRSRFNQGKTNATNIHVVVIIAVGDRIIGILVDRVSDILTVDSSEIRPVPDIDDREEGEHIIGLVTAEERMVALLDTASLFKSEIIEQTVETAEDLSA
ncbi:chemotaxis protein CheW [Sneathiella aquimaris]|uniref:chemotaxis protein CheW n=1 Tax=Sneathiella aquimaris TaxID=2599305 RepID=UPI00146ED494|nr:chemotaxis protein CheW [Sneathiella aquimaris]